MDAAPNNPVANALGPNITEAQISDAVRKSGYPLQTIVAKMLKDEFARYERSEERAGEGIFLKKEPLTQLAVKRLATLCRKGREFLQHLQNIVGAGNFRLARRVLDVERLHHAVLDQHSVTL
jgi:hypothetical protein